MTDSQRHTIFVPLWGNRQIELVVGDLQVNDGNLTRTIVVTRLAGSLTASADNTSTSC